MRFINMHEMVIMYEETREPMVSEMMALKATVDPMLMSESRIVTMRDTRTALRGMFQPGVTFTSYVSFHYRGGSYMSDLTYAL